MSYSATLLTGAALYISILLLAIIRVRKYNSVYDVLMLTWSVFAGSLLGVFFYIDLGHAAAFFVILMTFMATVHFTGKIDNVK
jgi:hypothetical protein